MDFKAISSQIKKASSVITRDLKYAGHVFTLGTQSPANEAKSTELWIVTNNNGTITDRRNYRCFTVASSIVAINGEKVPAELDDVDGETGAPIKAPAVDVLTAEVNSWPDSMVLQFFKAVSETHVSNIKAIEDGIEFDWDDTEEESDVDDYESKEEKTEEEEAPKKETKKK